MAPMQPRFPIVEFSVGKNNIDAGSRGQLVTFGNSSSRSPGVKLGVMQHKGGKIMFMDCVEANE